MGVDFDFQLAEHLARASDFAYHRDFQRQPELRPGTHRPFDQGTSHVSVLDYPDHVVVAFRGTEQQVSDWLKNFEARLVPCVLPNTALVVAGEVHEGFLSELTSVWNALQNHVGALVQAGKSLYVTGHSQGAAVAVVATAAFVAAQLPVTATYTFAAPRPGNDQFAQGLRMHTIHRLELGNDIVPHVPPTIPPHLTAALKFLLMGTSPDLKRLLSLANHAYVAVGTLAYGQVDEFVVPDMTPAQERHLFDVRLRRLFTAGETLVAHHAMTNYVAAVNKF